MQSIASLIVLNDADVYTQDIFNDVNSREPNMLLDGKFRQVMTGIA